MNETDERIKKQKRIKRQKKTRHKTQQTNNDLLSNNNENPQNKTKNSKYDLFLEDTTAVISTHQM